MHRAPLAVPVLIAAGSMLGLGACSSPRRPATAPTATTALTATAPATATATASDPATPVAPRTITATGDGQATGTPDTLTVDIGVLTTGAQATQALQTNNTEAAQLIAKLEADGVAQADIQTDQLNINPNYSGATPHITSYTVSDDVVAKLRQLTKAGQLLDDAVAAAGNDARVNSIGYSIDDDSALLAGARADAVRSATARARAMANAAGVTLGAVQQVTDVSPSQTYPQTFAAGSTAGSGGVSAPVPLQTGQEQLAVQVTVVYAIA